MEQLFRISPGHPVPRPPGAPAALEPLFPGGAPAALEPLFPGGSPTALEPLFPGGSPTALEPLFPGGSPTGMPLRRSCSVLLGLSRDLSVGCA